MSQFWRDVVYGLRGLRRKPGFTAAAVASLMLGIGTNTAIFTLLHAVFIRPLPLSDLDRLVSVYQTLKNDAGEYEGEIPLSYANYRDFAERLRDVELASYEFWPMNLIGPSEPQRVSGFFVSGNYFDVLGIEAARGRLLGQEDCVEASAPVAVLGYGLWTRLFGADPGVLGSAVSVNGESLTIVGVAPRGFRGTEFQASADVFLPISTFQRVSPHGGQWDLRESAIFRGVGRLRDGVTAEQASAEAMDVALQLAREYPEILTGLGARAVPLAENAINPTFRERYKSYARTPVIVAVILFIACLSVVNLLLVRGLERARELALRRALGAGRGRLARQLATENLLLFSIGALASLVVAKACLEALSAFRPPDMAADAFQLDLAASAWIFAFVVALAAGLAFGVWPAVRGARTEMVPNLKEAEAPADSARRRHLLRPRSLVVALQMGLALVALIGAGLLLRSLQRSADLDLGFTADGLAVFTVAPGEQGYDENRTRELYDRLLERTKALPGVTAAALSQNRLLRGSVYRRQVYLSGEAESARPFNRVNVVGTGFFETVGIPLRRGRDFRRQEGERPVAVINETMAAALWPGRDAIGQSFHFDYPTTPPIEVVGVAADARYRQIHEEKQFFIYLPLSQNYASTMTVHARTGGDPAALLPALRAVALEVDPGLVVTDLATMRHFVDEALWLERASAWLAGLFGALALALALVGIYGLTSYAVRSRRRELGIRIALGARRSHLLTALVLETLQVALLGVGIGLAIAAIILEPLMSSRLYGVSAVDPATYATWAAVLLSAALAGTVGPAWRAARTDPNETLRAE